MRSAAHNKLPDHRALLLAVSANEILRILRDRKAILLAVLLPMLAYPALMVGSDALGEASRRQIEEREVRLAADLSALEPGLAERVRAELLQGGKGLVLSEQGALDLEALGQGAEPGPLDPRAQSVAEALLGDEDGSEDRPAGILIGLRQEGADSARNPLDGTSASHRLVLYYRGASEDGQGIATQVLGPLSTLRDLLESEVLARSLGADPALAYALERVDVAPEEDRAGHALGRFLPLIAVVVLLSGGAFAALDAFSGEREQGTLETLLVQPVPAHILAYGKFAAVLATALVAWLGNVVSLLASAALGIVTFSGADLSGTSELSPERILLGGLVFLPTVVLVSAALCLVAARARSFREGQHYLLPATLLAAALSAPALLADVLADPILALVPILGPSLALRDAFAGQLALLPAALSFASSALYAALALRHVGLTLDAERLLAADSPARADRNRAVARRSLGAGVLLVALVYLVGGPLQSQHLVGGLLATLYGLVAGTALFLARTNRRDLGGSLAAQFHLAPSTAQALPWRLALLAAAVLSGPALAQAGRLLLSWQNQWMPLPEGFGQGELSAALERLSTPVLLALFALSPALTEELAMRGAVLSGLLRDPRRSVAGALWIQAFLFGLMHGSVHRLAITVALGLFLGWLTLRSGWLLLAVALHASYNGAVILQERAPELSLDHPLWWLGPTALLALTLSRSRGLWIR